MNGVSEKIFIHVFPVRAKHARIDSEIQQFSGNESARMSVSLNGVASCVVFDYLALNTSVDLWGEVENDTVLEIAADGKI